MKIWKYSAWDFLLVVITIFELSIKVGWAFIYDEVPLWSSILLTLILCIMYYYNFIVVNHEFMHTPFFHSKILNKIMLVFSSTNLLYPMTVINDEHHLHHVFNNDPIRKNTTQDPTSTYRKGKNRKQESWLPYALLNVFRANSPTEVRGIIKDFGKGSHGKIVVIELLCIALTIGFVLYVDWRWFFIGLVPSFYIGWVLTDYHNYFEHYHARNPFNRFANSVSYYGKLYNKIWFNEGYHQEHHLKPRTHWSKRPAVREKYKKEFKNAGLHVSKYPMYLSFLDRHAPIYIDPNPET